MRIIVVAMAIVMLMLPAAAQGISGGQGFSGGKRHRSQTPQMNEAEKQKRKADDAAYKAALDKIPNQQKADPWRTAR